MVYDLKTPPRATLFGAALRHAREARGWSQEALAQAAGLSAPYVNRLERGHLSDPHLRVLIQLADALDVSLDAFRGPRPAPAPAPAPAVHAGLAAWSALLGEATP